LALCLLIYTVQTALRSAAAFRRRGVPEFPAENSAFYEDVAPAEAFPEVQARLEQLPFKWTLANGVLYGSRRRWAAWGDVSLGLGLASLIVGGLLGILGPSGEVFVFEGYGVALPPAHGRGLELHVDRVDAAVDANTGDLLDYRTEVRVLDSGEEAAAGVVAANRPLRHRGVGIYQSRMGAAGSKGLLLEVVKLKKGADPATYGRAVFDWRVGDETGRLTPAPGEEAELGDTGLRFRYVDYLEYFYAGDAGLSDDGPAYNPVAFVNVVNARGETAVGFLYKLTPEMSFLRADRPDFDARAAEFTYVADDGPWRADRKEYLFASGSYLALGGKVLEVATAPGEDADLRKRTLEAKIASGGEEPAARYELPFARRVPFAARDDKYLLRFAGTRTAKFTAFQVTRNPGLPLFYVGCILLTVGAFGAALLRSAELFAFVRGGRVYVAGCGDVPSDVFGRRPNDAGGA
jgi:hypothetical protein